MILSVAWQPTYQLKALSYTVSRVLSRIYRLGEKSRVTEGHELPRGVRWHAPPPEFFFFKEYALRCNLVHFETILRNVTLCALTSSRLDDFSDIVSYILK